MTAAEIKHLRKVVLQLSQQELAAELGVSFSTVNRWERGHAEPQPDRLRRLRELVAMHQEPAGSSPEDKIQLAEPIQLDFEGDPESVKLVVDAFRLRNGHMFNRAYGLELSRVVPLPHQRIAVYDHLLREDNLRFLLADDAGAGKTIMAGLYIREMINRGRLARVLICCPAGLVYNWQRELKFFFELDFTILKGSHFKDQNPVANPAQSLFVISVDTATSANLQTTPYPIGHFFSHGRGEGLLQWRDGLPALEFREQPLPEQKRSRHGGRGAPAPVGQLDVRAHGISPAGPRKTRRSS